MYAPKDHLLVMSGVTVDIEDGTLFAFDDFDSTRKRCNESNTKGGARESHTTATHDPASIALEL